MSHVDYGFIAHTHTQTTVADALVQTTVQTRRGVGLRSSIHGRRRREIKLQQEQQSSLPSRSHAIGGGVNPGHSRCSR
jgi:hypothetical protein